VPRRNNDLWDELLTSTWWVSVVLAVVIYVGIKWFLPAFAGHNIFLRGIAQGLYGVAWMFTLPFIFVAGASAFISYRRRALLDSRTGLDSLRALSWQDFERLVGEAYRRRGYTIEEIGGSAPDGGVDLMLYSGGGKTVVQCKRWRTAQIGVSLVRELHGVVVAEKAARGIFVTTGTFTPDAVAFARDKPLELVDGQALAKLVEGVRTSKPSPATVHESATPSCPKCGGEMIRRVAKRGANAGSAFWGCRRYPGCTGSRNAL